MKTQIQLIEYLREHPGITDSKVCSNLGKKHGVRASDVKAARAALDGVMPETPIIRPSTVKARKDGGMSRAEFAAKYDNDTRLRVAIRSGVATLANPDEIIEDSVFRSQRCGNVHCNRFRQVAEEPEFRKHQLSKGGKVFWSHPSGVKWALENVEGAAAL